MPATLPYYTVCYQPRPPLVRGRVVRPLSATEFTEVCELLLAQAQHYACPYWLLDGRADEPTRPPDVYEWLADDFLPRARALLGLIPCLAFVAKPEFWATLRAHSYAPPRPALLSATFRANWFTTEEAALKWLDQFRPAIGWL